MVDAYMSERLEKSVEKKNDTPKTGKSCAGAALLAVPTINSHRHYRRGYYYVTFINQCLLIYTIRIIYYTNEYTSMPTGNNLFDPVNFSKPHF